MSAPLLYKEIYTFLRGRIYSGEYKPGDILPSENALCARFSASRETVRKSLKALENEGLIYSKMKVGYFVSVPNHSDFTLKFTETKEGFTTQFVEVHAVKPSEYLRTILELEPRSVVIEFSQLTKDKNGQPVAFDMKYVPYVRGVPFVENEMRFSIDSGPDFSSMAPFGYYTTIEVSAAGAPEKVAQLLDCSVGEPLLLVERTYINQNEVAVGYSRQYCRKSFGRLFGVSGPQKDLRKNSD